MAVRQDLELDVAGPLDVLLEVDLAVAEGLLGLAPGDVELLGEGDVVVGDPHAAPAAARDRLDDDRVADRRATLTASASVSTGPSLPGNDGTPAFRTVSLAIGLVAHQLDGLGLGADELDVAGLALLGEFGVFRQEPVARMDRVDIGDLRRADDPVGPQVAVRALRAADADGLVGELDVERLDVGLGIDRQGLDAQLAAGANDPKGDFAAVGDEDFLDHRVDD